MKEYEVSGTGSSIAISVQAAIDVGIKRWTIETASEYGAPASPAEVVIVKQVVQFWPPSDWYEDQPTFRAKLKIQFQPLSRSDDSGETKEV